MDRPVIRDKRILLKYGTPAEKEAITGELVNVSTSNIFDLVRIEVDEDGTQRLMLKDFGTIPEHCQRWVKKLKQTPSGIEVELHGKDSALRMLAQSRGILHKKAESAGVAPKDVEMILVESEGGKSDGG